VLRGEKAKHRDWAYSHLDDGRVLRDSRWLLEITKGGKGEKFFDCGESRDGTGYTDVTNSTDPAVQAARARFGEILAKLPEPKPRDGLTPGSQKQTKAERKQKKEADATGKRVPQTTPDRVARFGQRDKNHDGFLSHEEFMSTLAGSDKAAGETRFKKLDTDRDGQLTQDEFLGTTGKTE
jgi:hypothetical protein